MNAVLLERVAGGLAHRRLAASGTGFVITALFSEGALLFVAAQAGFVDGPRVMANMATDSWLPHRFAALSERLTMRNGVLLMARRRRSRRSSTRAATSASSSSCTRSTCS